MRYTCRSGGRKPLRPRQIGSLPAKVLDRSGFIEGQNVHIEYLWLGRGRVWTVVPAIRPVIWLARSPSRYSEPLLPAAALAAKSATGNDPYRVRPWC